ncbi:hypothetical protein D9758_000990 [Tetrapyrgos nigripes]|uniref:Small ribosomal subunit protein mS29 n=1 Tax=Tetrapyrgos nigripes TaxID=182062 RepID=A0A8H5GYX3_9AGAR|nr:hypothetical protein D9758_000990 [Tetrapyrgos nigripes]
MSFILSRASPCRPALRNALLSVAESRNYATAVPGKSNAFKMTGRTSKKKKVFSKKGRIPAWRSMPATQLSDPLFQSDNRTPIALPPFRPYNVDEEMVGKAVHFEERENDPIKFFGTPKDILLEYRLLSRRASVVRDVTVQTARLLDEAAKNPSKQTRVAITGSAGSGKSTLLLQAVRYCQDNEWIVIYIPRAKKTVDSTTLHQYDLRSQTYLQPKYALQLLQRTLNVNSALLTKIPMRRALTLEKRQIAGGISLAELATMGVKEPQIATQVLDHFMTELANQTTSPVLLAIDDFQAIYRERTVYRDPHFAHIRPYHLSMPRLLLEFASGKRSFSNGAVLGALTASDSQFPISNELITSLSLPSFLPWSPYDKANKSLMEYAKGLINLQVPNKFTLEEATAVFEVWMKDRSLSSPVNDESLLAKYTETGGHPRTFVWKGILATLEGALPEPDLSTPWPHLRELGI